LKQYLCKFIVQNKGVDGVNGYVQNRQQPLIEVLYEIAEILGVSEKELLIDNDIKKDN